MSSLIGQEIGGSLVDEFLGKGAMGEVYRAYDNSLNIPVAIKTLNKDLTTSYEAVERFKREAQGLAKINSPYIIKLWEVGEKEGIHFIKLEYVEGESLKEKLEREAPLPIETALLILYQLAKGLEAAHYEGIIHRDVKPDNILINQNGSLKIADLGIAKFLENSTLTAHGVIMGTPWYLSPEQVEGKGVDARSDIYSLGVLFFYMITGKFPFYGETTQELLYARLRPDDNPPSPRKHRKDLSKDIENLSAKMLEKDKLERFASASDVRREVKNQLLQCVKNNPDGILVHVSHCEGEWKELLEWAIIEMEEEFQFFVPFLINMMTNGNSLRQRRDGIKFLDQISFDISQTDQDVQISYHFLKEDYEKVDGYGFKRTIAVAERLLELYNTEPEELEKFLNWLRPKAESVFQESNRNLRKIGARILKKIDPQNFEIWKLFERLNSIDKKRRIAALGRLVEIPPEYNFVVPALIGVLWEEGREAKNIILGVLIKLDKENRDVWEKGFELISGDIIRQRKSISHLLKLEEKKLNWLKPLIFELLEDVNPFVMKSLFPKLKEENECRLQCILSMCLGRLLCDILSKNYPDTDVMKYLMSGFNTRAVEKYGESDTPAFVELENDHGLWYNCWNREMNYLDFTGSTWRDLSPHKQAEYAKAYQEWYAQKTDRPIKKVYKRGGVYFEMVLVPPGRFWMGSPEEEEGRKSTETMHTVIVTRCFYMLKCQITQEQWQVVMGQNPSHFKADRHPVERVSWEDCMVFCQKTGFLLPTEAQWEYACRSGTTSRYYWGEEQDGDYFYHKDNSNKKTRPVGEKKTNAFDLCDMAGNIWEWCADWYTNYPTTEVLDPPGPMTDSFRTQRVKAVNPVRVQRGGSWFDGSVYCRSASRSGLAPNYNNKILGFRIVKFE